MRGVALKLGQFLSMQDERSLVSKELRDALESARMHADIMPETQLIEQLEKNMGINWMNNFDSFEMKPFASASIGQVHKAVLKNGKTVAVKVQFPGVSESIDSDLNSIRKLLVFSNLLPKGLFLDNLIKEIKFELKNECNYLAEAENQRKIREFLKDDPRFVVPEIINELTTNNIITSIFEEGFTFDQIKSSQIDTIIRSRIG